jgi:hypothetical protein
MNIKIILIKKNLIKKKTARDIYFREKYKLQRNFLCLKYGLYFSMVKCYFYQYFDKLCNFSGITKTSPKPGTNEKGK